MTHAAAYTPLMLFNEYADELRNSRFVQSLRAGKIAFRIHWSQRDGHNVSSDFPHDEELKVFVLAFRMYLAQNESFSFVRLRNLYPKLSIAADTRIHAIAILDRVAAYRAAPSSLIMDQLRVTREHVLKVGLFGGLAHANRPDLKAIRDYWRSHPALEVLLASELNTILAHMFDNIHELKAVNECALKEIGFPSATT